MAQLEEITGFTFKTLKKKLSKVEPIRTDTKGTFYSSKEVLPILYFQKDDKALDLTRERARLAKAQADKTEFEVRKMTKELLPSEEVEDIWTKYINNTRGKLLLLPKKMTRKLRGVTEPLEVEKLLNASVYDSLEELAKGDELDNT